MYYYICYKGKDMKPIIMEIDKETALEIYKLHFQHLCFGCKKASNRGDVCPKVLDIEKQTLFKYKDFINESFQLFSLDKKPTEPIDEDFLIEPLNNVKFIITSCKNHEEGDKNTKIYTKEIHYSNLTEEVSKRLVLKRTNEE